VAKLNRSIPGHAEDEVPDGLGVDPSISASTRRFSEPTMAVSARAKGIPLRPSRGSKRAPRAPVAQCDGRGAFRWAPRAGTSEHPPPKAKPERIGCGDWTSSCELLPGPRRDDLRLHAGQPAQVFDYRADPFRSLENAIELLGLITLGCLNARKKKLRVGGYDA
jgi:hypothetical protein